MIQGPKAVRVGDFQGLELESSIGSKMVQVLPTVTAVGKNKPWRRAETNWLVMLRHW